MKSVLFIIIVTPALFFSQKFEITASYGTPSIEAGATEVSESIVNAFIGKPNPPSSRGVLTIGLYVNSTNEKWRYGVDVSNEFFEGTEDIKKQNYTSVLPTINYMWLKPGSKGQLYSGAGLGVLIQSYNFGNFVQEDKKTLTKLGFNVTPVGFRFGRQLGGFVEVNFGAKGLFQGGISYKF